MIKNIRWETKGISIQRITFLGMFLSFLFIAKYVFGFIAGFETTTFLFIIAALMFPWKDALILVVAFNLLNLVFYGFGSWWIVYWFIWPADIIITKFISKMTRNKFVLAVAGFFMGLSLILWFYLSDLIILGSGYAVANTISAIPINLMGGIGAFVLIILLAEPMLRVSDMYSVGLWGKAGYKISKVKNLKLNLGVSISLATIGVASTTTLLAKNDFFLNWKDDFVQGLDVEYRHDHLMPYLEYQYYKKSLEDDEIAIVVVDGDDYWVDVLSYKPSTTLYEMLNTDVEGRYEDDTIFTFQAKHYEIGWFIMGFMVDDVHDEFQYNSGAAAMFTWDKMNSGSGVTINPATLYQFSYTVYQ